MTDYKKLQNGSDVRGIALPGVAGEAVNLTPEIARDIAASFGRWLAARCKKPTEALTLSVGRDSRLSGEALTVGVLDGLTALGIRVADCGLASTPAIFMSTVLPEFSCDGGIMITASHLPFNRNGLKFFTREGGLEHEDITALLEGCAQPLRTPPQSKGPVFPSALMEGYAAHLRRVICTGIGCEEREKPLAGFKIAVDAGNGGGGFFPRLVLEPLGADCSASVYLEPDGHFPNHIPNPENKAAMDSICQAVQRGGCDLGIIFDTDVDRAAAVDSCGREISRNRLIALMSSIVAAEAPGSVIVTDSVTSSQLADFITGELGSVHHRFMRGYKNVINEAIRLNAAGETCLLAIETSGHGALRENYFLDDGAYLSAKIIIKMARLRKEGGSLDRLLDKLKDPLEAKEYRMKLLREDFRPYGEQILRELEAYAKQREDWVPATDNHEGFRASVPAYKGWFLLRLSLHDPLMPLNIESDCPGGVAAIVGQLRAFLERYEALEHSALS